MDKAISVEERIKRAEEIYNRRNNGYTNITNKRKEKRKKSRTRKLLMQIFVCLIIYMAYYVFMNSDYIFSKEFLNHVKSTFSEESKINGIYLNIKTFIQDKISTVNEQTVENQNEITNKLNNQVEEESLKENVSKKDNQDSIGGAKNNIEETKKEEKNNLNSSKPKQSIEKTEMEKDAEYVKNKIKFIKPVEGRISSTFGWRNPTTSTVPKYHTGLDIASSKGTIIKSATEGKVILASSEGDYGKHYKIQNGEVIIIYAHCSKLYLKEGDKVKKGQKIAEVGSTGNSTGPHLHFEIRREDRLIDPQLVLDI